MSYRPFCERFMAALAAGDRAAMGDMLHPDFVIDEAASLPYAGRYHGLDGWLTLARAVTGAWREFRIEPIEYPGEGPDTFLVRFAISGRSRRTGKPFETTVLELWRFEDDRLKSILPYYFDTHALVAADSE